MTTGYEVCEVWIGVVLCCVVLCSVVVLWCCGVVWCDVVFSVVWCGVVWREDVDIIVFGGWCLCGQVWSVDKWM